MGLGSIFKSAVGGAGSILGSVSESLGFSRANPEQIAPGTNHTYQDLFDKALNSFQSIGAEDEGNTKAIRSALGSQLGSLDDNAAGRKRTFMEDMARGFSADTQNLARARGGTGSAVSALRPSGSMYDAQARGTARGLNDLYSQATQDLSTLGGVHGGLVNQDAQRKGAIGDFYQNELNRRHNINVQNADHRWNAVTQQQKALGGTIKGASKLFGVGGAD